MKDIIYGSVIAALVVSVIVLGVIMGRMNNEVQNLRLAVDTSSTLSVDTTQNLGQWTVQASDYMGTLNQDIRDLTIWANQTHEYLHDLRERIELRVGVLYSSGELGTAPSEVVVLQPSPPPPKINQIKDKETEEDND